MKKKIALYAISAVVAAIAVAQYRFSSTSYTYKEEKLPSTFEEFYQEKLAASKKLNVRPNN